MTSLFRGAFETMNGISSLVLSFLSVPTIAWRNRSLLLMLSRRNVESRYKGSVLGLVWSFVQPLLMMTVYTIVFGVFFGATWPGEIGRNPWAFPVLALCGMSTFSIFSESVSACCGEILGNPNYVKKVLFPLELLPFSRVLATVALNLTWFVLLFFGAVFLLGRISFTMLLLPVMLVPLILFTLGISFFVSSLSVYLRDTQHLVSVVIQVLFFLTPIFYSLEGIEPCAATILSMSPLAYVVETIRAVFIYGQMPNWHQFGMVTAACFVVMQLGFVWFEKTKKGFADVI